jgi:hypothetical protein
MIKSRSLLDFLLQGLRLSSRESRPVYSKLAAFRPGLPLRCSLIRMDRG